MLTVKVIVTLLVLMNILLAFVSYVVANKTTGPEGKQGKDGMVGPKGDSGPAPDDDRVKYILRELLEDDNAKQKEEMLRMDSVSDKELRDWIKQQQGRGPTPREDIDSERKEGNNGDS